MKRVIYILLFLGLIYLAWRVYQYMKAQRSAVAALKLQGAILGTVTGFNPYANL